MSAELCLMTARDLAAGIRNRTFSSREVMAAHLDRIDRLNPAINAIVSRLDNSAALALADEADRVLASGAPVGPLHGLPAAVKDLDDAVGFPTTQGSPIFRDFMPERDSLLVERLRKAGLLIIGKTNVPEFGLGSHTYNTVFGATKNPWNPTRTAGGSSGGAAAAVTARMLPVADGSDMGGSLRNPGNFNNVVGFRPSPGLVPTWPTSTPWLGLSVKGPIARNVADTALLLGAISGDDPRDQLAYPVDPTQFVGVQPRPGRGTRIAWCPDLGGLPLDPQVRKVLDAQRDTFVQMGCIVDDIAPDLTDAEEIFQVLRAASLAGSDRNLLETHRDLLKPEAIWNIEQGLKLTAADTIRAMSKQQALFERLRVFMETYDFFCCAVNQVPPFPIEWSWPQEIDGTKMENYISWMRSAYWVTVTRSPAISVPAGFTDDGLPVGIQVVGRFRDDLGTLAMAAAFEEATRFAERMPDLAD